MTQASDLRKRQNAAISGSPSAAPAETDPMTTLLARLEGLLDAFWLTAVSGDVKAAELVRRVLAQQAEMYGKLQPPAANEGDDELSKLRARRTSA